MENENPEYTLWVEVAYAGDMSSSWTLSKTMRGPCVPRIGESVNLSPGTSVKIEGVIHFSDSQDAEISVETMTVVTKEVSKLVRDLKSRGFKIR